MCLIVFNWGNHSKYKLILVGNRDEFYDRKSLPVHHWKDYPILGGRDLEAGGTWMAINKKGHVAALTNYRDIQNIRKEALTRGQIPVDYLLAKEESPAFMETLQKNGFQYNGFNFLTFDQHRALHYSNYGNGVNEVSPGVHGLSNALMDTPWYKVTHAMGLFKEIISESFSHRELISMMGDTTPAHDSDLPDTGLPYEMEKAVSAMCIKTENYGTCCTTAVTIDHDNQLIITEQSYAVGERKAQTVEFKLTLPS